MIFNVMFSHHAVQLLHCVRFRRFDQSFPWNFKDKSCKSVKFLFNWYWRRRIATVIFHFRKNFRTISRHRRWWSICECMPRTSNFWTASSTTRKWSISLRVQTSWEVGGGKLKWKVPRRVRNNVHQLTVFLITSRLLFVRMANVKHVVYLFEWHSIYSKFFN